MQTVVLDTNALLMPFEIGLNIDLAVRNVLGDVRMVVPEPLMGELGRSKNKFAKAAIKLAQKYEIVPTENMGDYAVLELAVRTEGVVLTNDRELRSRLRTLKIPTMYLRSGTHLVLEEEKFWKEMGHLREILSISFKTMAFFIKYHCIFTFNHI